MTPRHAALLFLVLLAGCSAQQAYHTGQAWQRQQCLKLPDDGERERCLSRTNQSYEDYRRQTEAGKN